jgi:tetratricopeptide (TPR) repeat protein
MRQLTLIATIRLALVLAVGAVAVTDRCTVIPVAAAEETSKISEADMTFFYKNASPERVRALMVYFDSLFQSKNPNAEPPILGFLAVVFQRYPNDIDKMIPDGLSPDMQRLTATALWLAGQDKKARSMADHLKTSGSAAPDWLHLPTSLDAVEVTGPTEFDMMWGASFASGDPQYCLRILDRFAAVANADGNADDMVNLARNFAPGSDPHWLIEKRGPEKARDLIGQSTALWGLDANARQHEFVRSALGKYITAHPEEPASKALLALAQAYGHYDVRKVMAVIETSPGKSSVTLNGTYFAQVLNDLERHAGSYPPKFQFADDRQRAERDIATLSDLLDPLFPNLSHDAPLQLRLAALHTVGFNLDIPGSFEKARSDFSAILATAPENPEANYQYGAFLAATTRKGEGIPFLEKASSLGVVNADYWLGWSYVALGEKTKAIENLERYTKNVPNDQRAAQVLDAVRNDKVNFVERKPSP